MFAQWLLAIASPLAALPSPMLQGEPTVVAIASDPIWLRPRCLSVRCGDEEWRREAEPLAPLPGKRKPRLPGARTQLPLSAPAVRRDTHSGYSNEFRVGTRFGYQLMRERDVRVGLEVGAGYRMASLYDDGVSVPGPIFRGGISLGRRFGERAWWSQRVQFETGRGERFVKQMFGLDVDLPSDWSLETDYVIRYGSQQSSGSETAEAWFGFRRRF